MPDLSKFAFKHGNGRKGADVPGPCLKCADRTKRRVYQHHIVYGEGERLAPLCVKCHANITSVNSCSGLANKGRLSDEQREYLWSWFLGTRYFETHRRFSRGRARRLLQRDVEWELSVNPANVPLTGGTIQVADDSRSTPTLPPEPGQGFVSAPYSPFLSVNSEGGLE